LAQSGSFSFPDSLEAAGEPLAGCRCGFLGVCDVMA